MPASFNFDFIDQPQLKRRAESMVARLGTAAEMARDGLVYADDFARQECAQLAGRIELAAQVGEPTDADWRAAVIGKDVAYNDKLSAMDARAAAFAAQAEADDVENGIELSDIEKKARATVAGTALGPAKAANPWTQLIGAVLASTAPVSAPQPAPDDLRRRLSAVVGRMVHVEVGRGLAAAINRRAASRRVALHSVRQSSQSVQKAVATVKVQAATALTALGARPNVLPYDLILDGPVAARHLLRKHPGVDWSEIVLQHADGLDEGSAKELVRTVLAGVLADVAQHPFPVLLPRLVGDRSVQKAIQDVISNSSPLAPLQPKEAPDGFHGLAIGVVEARDKIVETELMAGLQRAGDIVRKAVDVPDLPDDVQARIVRFRGVLPTECTVRVVLDLYTRTTEPSARGGLGSQDWEGDLPALISAARLRREIDSLTAQGYTKSVTALLERWLPRTTSVLQPVAPATATTPTTPVKSVARSPSSPVTAVLTPNEDEDDDDVPTAAKGLINGIGHHRDTPEAK